MDKGMCLVDGCVRPVRCKSLCNAHHIRNLRYGDPLGTKRPTMRARFESKILRRDNGCWEWAGAHFQATGYAIFNVPSEHDGRWRPRTAHRVSYQLYIGPIPGDRVIDHLCRNRGCVNPAHLEAVTTRENVLRGCAPSAVVVRENRCHRGHEFTPENTITRVRNGRTKRDCRECTRARDRERNKTDERRAHYRAMYRRRQASALGGDVQ